MDLHIVILSWDGFQWSAWIVEADANHFPVLALPNGWNADEELDRISELLLFCCIRGGVEDGVVNL